MKLVSGHFEQLECTLEFTLKIKKNSLFLKQLNFIKVPSFSRCTFSTKMSFFKTGCSDAQLQTDPEIFTALQSEAELEICDTIGSISTS